jgi:hypothetical protein
MLKVAVIHRSWSAFALQERGTMLPIVIDVKPTPMWRVFKTEDFASAA